MQDGLSFSVFYTGLDKVNDAGVNDEFKILRKSIAILNYFSIFNRWGDVFFVLSPLKFGGGREDSIPFRNTFSSDVTDERKEPAQEKYSKNVETQH